MRERKKARGRGRGKRERERERAISRDRITEGREIGRERAI